MGTCHRWPPVCTPGILRAWQKHTKHNENVCNVVSKLFILLPCLFKFLCKVMLYILHSSNLTEHQHSFTGWLGYYLSKVKIHAICFSLHHPMLTSKWISCQVDGPGPGILLLSISTYSSGSTKALLLWSLTVYLPTEATSDGSPSKSLITLPACVTKVQICDGAFYDVLP